MQVQSGAVVLLERVMGEQFLCVRGVVHKKGPSEPKPYGAGYVIELDQDRMRVVQLQRVDLSTLN